MQQQSHHQYLNRSFEQDNPTSSSAPCNPRIGVSAGSGESVRQAMAPSHNAMVCGTTAASNVKDIAVSNRMNVDDSDSGAGIGYGTSNVYHKGHR